MSNFGARKSDEPLNDVFSAYNANSAEVVATPATLPLDTEHLASSPTFALANNEVTVGLAGNYEIAYGSSLLVGISSSSRTQGRTWLERNGLEVGGSRCLMYLRLTNMGATGSAQLFLTLDAGDVLRIRGQRTAGGASMRAVANGTRLCLRRL